MIARTWSGRTRPEDADAYEELLRAAILPHIDAETSAGYRGADLLRRDGAEEVEFVTVLWFETEQDLASFAGREEPERAVVPPEARELLADWDERARHYRRVADRSETGSGRG